LIFGSFFFACFRGEFEASMFESSTHVIDDSCCSLFCLYFVLFFFFFCFPFVLRSGVTHGRLLLQLKLCFCRVDFFFKKNSVILITLVISLDFLLFLSFCGFGEHHFDGLAFECSPKALMDFFGEGLL
jgi:hypothetical protein